MKRYVKASQGSWIDDDTRELLVSEDFDVTGEDMEDFWNQYLADPETEVLDELQIMTEPSGQGSYFEMYLVDDSREGRFESVGIDGFEWNNNEITMALDSASPAEYKEKFKSYVKDICNI